MEARVKEIFSSIQGEGPYVGYEQLFIRFCGCNLKCNYCDTDFKLENSVSYTPESLYEKISSEYDLASVHSISLTGGEPLLHHEFLKEFLKLITGPRIYLETNATLYKELDSVINYVDIISADIKLKSATGLDTSELHEKFFKKCKGSETFIKVVFDENITDEEISFCINTAEKYLYELVLQPKMDGSHMCVSPDFCKKILKKFNEEYLYVRLIPQVHKYLNVE